MLEVRENYKSSYASLNCELCDLHVDSQKNLLICTKLTEDKCLVASSPTYEDLFSSDVEKQIKIWKKNSFNKKKVTGWKNFQNKPGELIVL